MKRFEKEILSILVDFQSPKTGVENRNFENPKSFSDVAQFFAHRVKFSVFNKNNYERSLAVCAVVKE
jgi:hypothetical protein